MSQGSPSSRLGSRRGTARRCCRSSYQFEQTVRRDVPQQAHFRRDARWSIARHVGARVGAGICRSQPRGWSAACSVSDSLRTQANAPSSHEGAHDRVARRRSAARRGDRSASAEDRPISASAAGLVCSRAAATAGLLISGAVADSRPLPGMSRVAGRRATRHRVHRRWWGRVRASGPPCATQRSQQSLTSLRSKPCPYDVSLSLWAAMTPHISQATRSLIGRAKRQCSPRCVRSVPRAKPATVHPPPRPRRITVGALLGTLTQAAQAPGARVCAIRVARRA